MRVVIACTSLILFLSLGTGASSQQTPDNWRKARTRTSVTRLSKLTQKSHAATAAEKEVFRIQRRERGRQGRERRATPQSNRLGIKSSKPSISKDEL